MKHDRRITISVGASRKAKLWQAQSLMWSEMAEKLRTPVIGEETQDEYMAMPKSAQDERKDVGGFVAGTLTGGHRKAGSVIGRDVVTLDLDNIPAGRTDEVIARLDALKFGYAVYSTRKHAPERPRLRVLLPMARTVDADEYEPIARKAAEYIGLNYCDPTTFEANRLMYWPSTCKGAPYVYGVADRSFLDPDGMLVLYADWRDTSQWPQVPGQENTYRKLANKQGEPTEKKGIVGAFCRQYDVPAAMDKWIAGEYIPCDNYEDRYTYSGGSTTGGAVLYDDGKFLYSHHATDPAGGRLCNAFDLVRLHLYGDMDDDAEPGTPVHNLPSYKAMAERALSDKAVAQDMTRAQYEQAQEDFGKPFDPEEIDLNWMDKLQMGQNGYVKSINNVRMIILLDPALKGKIAFDGFSRRLVSTGPLPWNAFDGLRPWDDTDDAGIRNYMESAFGITGKDRIYDGVALAAKEQEFNHLQDYLKGLRWDGQARVETLIIDYLGAEDTPYTRAVTRKSLAAAVGRAMDPGVKYDYMPVLGGPQGIGKSTLLKLLGKEWYSDSLTTFSGKEAAEMVQGTWINEIGELASMNRSETNEVKQFLSKTEDIYRKAYGRRTEVYPRSCVFFGTTNDYEYLRDSTGNRRFWPVDCWKHKPTKDIWEQLETEIDQIWAEAYMIWANGERLYLSREMEEEAKKIQEEHEISNSKEGLIAEFLESEVPEIWSTMSLGTRMVWLQSGQKAYAGKTVKRDRVCAAEVWCECFNQDLMRMRQTDAREINSIIMKLGGWERRRERYPIYGIQRGFNRVISPTENVLTLPFLEQKSVNNGLLTDVTLENEVSHKCHTEKFDK